MNILMIDCYICKHFTGKITGKAELGCKAFPNGIPEAIRSGKRKHTQPIEGDHGIQFEPVEGK